MAPRKRKKKQIDEGPFLFSEEEMLGMIENVTIIQTPESPKETNPTDSVDKPETKVETSASVELSSDERMISTMAEVLRQMSYMTKSEIRRIAFTITVVCEQGMELNKQYDIPIISNNEISGYELAAWCYCTFMESFPSMKDKLHLPYASHYEKAKELITL
ncbi:MAG: hypothetical protein KBT34_13305 [Prevotella sp.]|nr:hypothetical protein [Candidatus Prevotella equi]